MSSFTTVNPATGAAIERYACHADGAVDRMLDRAVSAWQHWRHLDVGQRVDALGPLVDALGARRDELAQLATTEMGKPIRQSLGEVDKTIDGVSWFLGAAPDALANEVRDPGEPDTVVTHRPYGPVLGIMPWNFPYWQVLRSIVPALLAGNAYLLKPSPVTIGAGLAVRDVLATCDLPPGLFDVLLIETDTVGRTVEDSRIAAVTLTGSVQAGRAVAQLAGRALKPAVMELGGSDPLVVLADANLDQAADVAVAARMQNTGQSCLAAKRFIVERPIADAFADAVDERIASLVVDDPADPDTDIGPMAFAGARDDLDDQVRRAVAAGAVRRRGAEPIDRAGAWYQPGSLGSVEPDNPAGAEELFGPVATIQVASDPEDALRRAVASPFGLGAAVWTTNTDVASRFVDGLRAGTIAVNQMTRSDPRYPFGGFGHSGHGRELSIEGLREFTAPVTTYGAPTSR